MKVLVICQYYYPEQFRINDICEELVKKGNEITVLTGLPNYPSGIIPKEYRFHKKRKQNINGVNVLRTWEIGRKKGKIFRILNYLSFAISASIKVLFLSKKYDCIFVYQLSPVTMAIPAILYKKRCKKLMHLYCLDLWPSSLTMGNIKTDSAFYKMMKKISKWIYKSSDTISISSNQFERYLRSEIGISNNRIVYLPQYAEEMFSQIKENNEIKEYVDFVFAGNIGEAQSVKTIILAANELKNEKIKIHIVGDGSSLKECKDLSNKLKLNNVFFYGEKPIEDMKYFYNLADAMLVTLKKDEVINMTLPGKVQSYMAAGKPIIGAIGGETKEIIEKSKCGYCVEEEDYINLAKIMKKFKDDDTSIKEQMAKQANIYYKENFDKQGFIKKLIKILENK